MSSGKEIEIIIKAEKMRKYVHGQNAFIKTVNSLRFILFSPSPQFATVVDCSTEPFLMSSRVFPFQMAASAEWQSLLSLILR